MSPLVERPTTYLITGGSGSFGTAFIKATLAEEPHARIVSLSRCATLRYQLRRAIPDPRLTVLAGDVTKPWTFDAVPHVDVIIHAAAEKHIDTGEKQIPWVWEQNHDGSVNIATFAKGRGARLVGLSTDKACNPCNEYGRSKAAAELELIKVGSVVRYGNVVNSAGSVLPLFIEQRKEGRLTVTDLRMTRYFMALSADSDWGVVHLKRPIMSAVGLVRYALHFGRGGEIFIPDIPSGTIINLAQEMGACEIEQIGIRPGEKLHEELIHEKESPRCWRTPDGTYVLMPTVDDVPAIQAERVPAGFSYASNHHAEPLQVYMEVAA